DARSPPPVRHAADSASLAHRAPPGQALEHRLRRSLTEAAFAREGQLKAHPAGESACEARGETVGGHDVEAGAREERASTLARLGAAAEDGLEDLDLAGDVQVVLARHQASLDDRGAGGREGTRCEEHRRDALELPRDLIGRGEREDPPIEAEALSDGTHRLLATSREDRP